MTEPASPWAAAPRILDAIRAQPPSQRRAERVAVLRRRYAHVVPWTPTPAPHPKPTPAPPARPEQMELL